MKIEGRSSTHGQPLSSAGVDFAGTVKLMGGDPEDSFVIFTEVAEFYAKRKEELIEKAAAKKRQEKEWAESNPVLADKLASFFSGRKPDFDYSKIDQKANNSTRAASAIMLSAFANEVENMVVSSADLSNSDKTDGFLKNTRAFTKGDFSGAFLQAGVCELTMACIMNGMALHGGIIPVCGTFFVFSDYMKPAVRLSALMELPVIYLWTHDAFRVGEDGPTHQPIEHEAQIRLMEKLKNHNGHNSILVLRPADSCETTVAWKMALENTSTPTVLILSRQNIMDLPAKNRFEAALESDKGAYVVEDCNGIPDVVLLASGSEVATLVASAKLLRTDNVKIRVVSVPSEGLFKSQSEAYQRSILPLGAPRFGLTSGLPVNLEGLVGDNGKVFGLDHFGYSAPAGVLDEKFGFTADNIYHLVKSFLQTRSSMVY